MPNRVKQHQNNVEIKAKLLYMMKNETVKIMFENEIWFGPN